MKIYNTGIEGAYLIDLNVFGDERGFFLESYNKKRYFEHGIDANFIQDNRSYSQKGVLRGLHYQIKHPIGHLIYVIRGSVFDVGLDLREDSKSFGKHIEYTLSAKDNQQLFLPAGVAHGFCALEEENEVLYKCTDYYVPDDEAGILWNDPSLSINWPDKKPLVKKRDAAFPLLKDVSQSQLPKV